ncbi:MAG: copper transport protein [Frankiales bacterium]|jgi:copper transport protein|nr:copper transport protein [Frankiales bacterium]
MSLLLARLRRLAVIAVMVPAALVGPAGAAQAHSYLVGSAPADGAVLAASPPQLQLRFSESIEVASTRIAIVGSDGKTRQPTSIESVSAGGTGSPGISQPVLLLVGLPSLQPDAYRISWETVSTDDLHRTSGVIVFGVQRAVTAAGLHETAPALPESALRWLLFLALAVAVGATTLAGLYRTAIDGPFGEVAVRRARELAVTGAIAAVLVSFALLAQQLSASGESLSRLMHSSYGTRWLVREAGLICLVLASVVRARVGSTASWLRWVVAAAAAASAVGFALLGHAGAGVMTSPTRVAADAAHLLAAAVWSGTLLAAAVVVVPRLRPSGGEAVAARAAMRRFLVPAASCVAVMVATGVYLASGVIGSVDALIVTTYGRVLMVKLVLVAGAGILGLANTAALHREGAALLRRAIGLRRAGRVRTDRPRLLVPEAVVAATVLAASALLTSGQPAREPQLVRYAGEQVVPVADAAAADLQETLTLKPNLPGANVLLVGVFDTRRPSPGRVVAVDVVVGNSGPAASRLSLTPLADGNWSAPASLVEPGAVDLTVTVHRQGLPDARAGYRWVVGGAPDQTRRAIISTAPLATPLRLAAGGAALLGAGAVLALLMLRRRSRAESRYVPDDLQPEVPLLLPVPHSSG